MNTELGLELATRVASALKATENAVMQIGDKITASIRCCPNCENFDAQNETCKLAEPPQHPPARIIAFGCDAFEEGIPF